MKIKHCLAMAICCIPPIAIAILGILGIGLGGAFGLLSTESIEIGVIFAVMMGIACPVIMGLMMWMMFRDMRPSQHGLQVRMDERHREGTIT